MDEETRNFFENLTLGSELPAAEPEITLASVKADVHAEPIAPRRPSPARVRATKEPAAAHESHHESPAPAHAAEHEPASIFSDEEFAEGEGQLTVDVYQTSNDIVLQSTIAGVEPDQLEVAINNEMVTIRGKRQKSDEVETKDYFVQELYWGAFSRTVILPQEIDSEKAIAELKNGVLTVRLPKIKKQKVKRLKIKAQ